MKDIAVLGYTFLDIFDPNPSFCPFSCIYSNRQKMLCYKNGQKCDFLPKSWVKCFEIWTQCTHDSPLACANSHCRVPRVISYWVIFFLLCLGIGDLIAWRFWWGAARVRERKKGKKAWKTWTRIFDWRSFSELLLLLPVLFILSVLKGHILTLQTSKCFSINHFGNDKITVIIISALVGLYYYQAKDDVGILPLSDIPNLR